jgi:hypothetical protein
VAKKITSHTIAESVILPACCKVYVWWGMWKRDFKNPYQITLFFGVYDKCLKTLSHKW